MTQESVLFILGGGVMSSLVGAVVYLFRAFEEEKRQTRKDLEECRKDREELWHQISQLKCSISS
jgi:hypothetical protein